jgi:hypothetical protein
VMDEAPSAVMTPKSTATRINLRMTDVTWERISLSLPRY